MVALLLSYVLTWAHARIAHNDSACTLVLLSLLAANPAPCCDPSKCLSNFGNGSTEPRRLYDRLAQALYAEGTCTEKACATWRKQMNE